MPKKQRTSLSLDEAICQLMDLLVDRSEEIESRSDLVANLVLGKVLFGGPYSKTKKILRQDPKKREFYLAEVLKQFEANQRLLQSKAYKSMNEAIKDFSEQKEEAIAENTIDKLMKVLEED